MTPLPAETSAATIAGAQREMRFAYYGGAPGMLTSATVWLIAGIVCLVVSPERALWALFIGGMFIHPVSVLLTKALGCAGQHSAHNPFGSLALATTFWMILMMPLAYGVSRLHLEWFFPAMLFIIGGRYLTFSTLFGARTFWFLRRDAGIGRTCFGAGKRLTRVRRVFRRGHRNRVCRRPLLHHAARDGGLSARSSK